MLLVVLATGLLASACGSDTVATKAADQPATRLPATTQPARRTTSTSTTAAHPGSAPVDIYAHDRPGMLSPVVAHDPALLYVPNSESDTVDVIDQKTHRVIRHFAVGRQPQHIVPSWDLRTLWVTNDLGNSLTAINPRTGKPGRTVPVDDPYNLYFTPDGKHAIVVAERFQRLDFRNPHSMHLQHELHVRCAGIDHIDFTADGTTLLASCEFSGKLAVVDLKTQRLRGTIALPGASGSKMHALHGQVGHLVRAADGGAGPDGIGMPQDVKLSPDGRTFYVADNAFHGLWLVDAKTWRVRRFLRTGLGAHGIYVSRDSKVLYVSNRMGSSVSLVGANDGRLRRTWHLPGGASPDMGGVSADGTTLWLTGRYNHEIYGISTRNGHLVARIPVGSGPHGMAVYPQPGRYSLGHTGVFR